MEPGREEKAPARAKPWEVAAAEKPAARDAAGESAAAAVRVKARVAVRVKGVAAEPAGSLVACWAMPLGCRGLKAEALPEAES